MDKLVSIIIPVYNRESFLEKLLESLINQTYQNIEIILVDDGSSDSSTKIISDYISIDNRIKLISQQNAGAPAARNAGLDISKGDFVCFFDSDDIMYHTAIEEMLLVANSNDIVIGDVRVVNESGRELRKVNYQNTSEEFNQFFVLALPGNKMIKKDFIDKFDIKFRNVKIGQDLLFYLELLGRKPKVEFCESITMDYLEHENSISKSYDSRILDIINVFNIIENEYRMLGIYSEYEEALMYLKVNNIATQIFKCPFIKENQTEILSTLVKEIREVSLLNKYILKNKKTLVKCLLIKQNQLLKLYLSYLKTRVS